MHTHDHCEDLSIRPAAIQESRSSHCNVAIRHPSRWRLLADLFLASPMRLHRYRHLSMKMLEETLKTIDSEKTDGGNCR